MTVIFILFFLLVITIYRFVMNAFASSLSLFGKVLTPLSMETVTFTVTLCNSAFTFYHIHADDELS